MSVNKFINNYKYFLVDEKEKDNRERIQKIYNSGVKTSEPLYSIKQVAFNEETRATTVTFLEKTLYRTIERYVQSNYVKTPIYSSWKTKTKNVKEHVKLTNANLENLQTNESPLIREYCSVIIASIGEEHLLPSWFQKECIEAFRKQEYQNIKTLFEKYRTEYERIVNNANFLIGDKRATIRKTNFILNKKIIKYESLNNKVTKIKNSKKSIAKSIFTLGIYAYLISKSRVKKLDKKIGNLSQEITKYHTIIDKCNDSIAMANNDIAKAEDNKNKNDKEIKEKYDLIQNYCEQFSLKVKTLPTSASTNDDQFKPLIQILGLEKQSIKGIYIIRNVLNNKVYVGQSKNVLTRINQHFQKDCSPKNIIFAEDYYSCPEDKRSDLFEVKIFQCETKDELDVLEKHYIEFYDANNVGYNRTAGNS